MPQLRSQEDINHDLQDPYTCLQPRDCFLLLALVEPLPEENSGVVKTTDTIISLFSDPPVPTS